MLKLALAAIGITAALPCTAHALCIYKQEFSAKTTLAQEFRDSRWVVRAEVISARQWRPRDGEAGTTYRLRVVRSYKGRLPTDFVFFTERNSGGFYLDRGAEPDIGGQYLLFLVPNPRPAIGPAEARNAVWVNYSCGQSKPWAAVPATERRTLQRLSSAG